MNEIDGRISTELRSAYTLAASSLGARRDVTGVDIGYKYRAGRRDPDLALRIHVRQKMLRGALSEHETIPSMIGGVRTDVIQGRYRAHAGSTSPLPWQRHDTVRPGISAGNPKSATGTIGLVVTDDDTGATCLLSAGHVFAGRFAADRDAITQPARVDFGVAPADTVAELLRWQVPGPWGDAAVARLNQSRPFALDQANSGVVVKSLDTPSLGQVLEKAGRTTRVTRGVVTGMGTYYYPGAEAGVGGFMLSTEAFDDPNTQDLTAEGDSGSVWYDPTTQAGIGLHVAGEVGAANEFAIACYLTRVMTTLRVSLALGHLA